MKRIPIDELQKKLYQQLVNHQTTPVYDDVTTDVTYPFITFGDFEVVPFGAKQLDASEVTVNLEIWSFQQGRKEINGIAEDLCQLLEYSKLELEEGFQVQDQVIQSFTVYPEQETGYHGTLVVKFMILNTK